MSFPDSTSLRSRGGRASDQTQSSSRSSLASELIRPTLNWTETSEQDAARNASISAQHRVLEAHRNRNVLVSQGIPEFLELERANEAVDVATHHMKALEVHGGAPTPKPDAVKDLNVPSLKEKELELERWKMQQQSLVQAELDRYRMDGIEQERMLREQAQDNIMMMVTAAETRLRKAVNPTNPQAAFDQASQLAAIPNPHSQVNWQESLPRPTSAIPLNRGTPQVNWERHIAAEVRKIQQEKNPNIAYHPKDLESQLINEARRHIAAGSDTFLGKPTAHLFEAFKPSGRRRFRCAEECLKAMAFIVVVFIFLVVEIAENGPEFWVIKGKNASESAFEEMGQNFINHWTHPTPPPPQPPPNYPSPPIPPPQPPSPVYLADKLIITPSGGWIRDTLNAQDHAMKIQRENRPPAPLLISSMLEIKPKGGLLRDVLVQEIQDAWKVGKGGDGLNLQVQPHPQPGQMLGQEPSGLLPNQRSQAIQSIGEGQVPGPSVHQPQPGHTTPIQQVPGGTTYQTTQSQHFPAAQQVITQEPRQWNTGLVLPQPQMTQVMEKDIGTGTLGETQNHQMSLLERAALQETAVLKPEGNFQSEPLLQHPQPDQGIGDTFTTQGVPREVQPHADGVVTGTAVNSQILSKLSETDVIPSQYRSNPSTNQAIPSQVHDTLQPVLEHRVDSFVRPSTAPQPYDGNQVHGGLPGPALHNELKLVDVQKVNKRKLPPMRIRGPPVPLSDLTMKSGDRPKGIKGIRRGIVRPEDKEVTAQGRKPERQSMRYKITHYKPK